MAEMGDVEGMIESLERVEAARREYHQRVMAIQKLSGSEFESAARELEVWVAKTNDELNGAARDILGEGLAVNGESLAMLRLSRNKPGTAGVA